MGSTRRVSLVREDKSDLQIVALERCDSFSSTSSDYEEIDLTAPTDVAIVEDKRTFPDSDETDNDSDVDNADSVDKCLSDSNGEEDETFETVHGGEEDDEREDSVEGYYGDPADDDNASNDDDDDVVENTQIMSDDDDIENNLADDDGDDDDDVIENAQIVSDDNDIENNLLDDDGDDDHDVGDDIDADDIGNSDALSEDNDNQNNDDLADEGDVENASDEGAGDNIGQNFPNNSEILEDSLLDSDNEINILNDISITIANESLTANKADEHLEIVDDEESENIGQIGHESDCEQINDENLISPQRIIVSHSDSEDESDSKDKNETKMLVEHHTIKSKLLVADKKDKDSLASSLTASSETAKTDLLTKGEEKSVQRKTIIDDVKASTITVKRNSKVSTVVKPELATTSTSKLEKESSQEIMPKEKTVEKAEEIGNEKEKARIANKSASNKAGSKDGKVAVASETKVSSAQGEDEEEMDFDQLSIEDEDSDFVEEEENLPVVKSKVGLNKIPIERSRVRTKRSSSRENRKRRRSYSPGRFRTSSRSYRNRSSSRDRLRSNRLRDRSRETYCRRSLSPQSKERMYRGSYSRGERGHSRDRTQNKITSVVSKNRENRRYRSRSRSDSRAKTGRTEKDLKSKNLVAKQTAKDSVKASVKERLEIKKEGNARSSSSPKKELNTRDNVVNKKAVKVKESKSSTVVLVANGAKVESSSTTIKATKVKVKQAKGWYRHVKNVYSKAFQIG